MKMKTALTIAGSDCSGGCLLYTSIAEYLATTKYDPKRIAVERNGDIVPKAQYPDTVLEDGDSVEVVSFVGGG